MIRRAGDRSVLIETREQDPGAAAAALRIAWPHELVDVVPGHETVLATWADTPATDAAITDVVASTSASALARPATPIVLPVTYDGVDLPEIAAAHGISIEAVIARHTATVYRVVFLGFLPGFGYLIGEGEPLQMPRRDEPRAAIPAGSVALGGEYCAVYPRESPGGWQLLGRTSATMFDPDRTPPALLTPGGSVRFEAVRG